MGIHRPCELLNGNVDPPPLLFAIINVNKTSIEYKFNSYLFKKLNLAVAADCLFFINCLSRTEVGRVTICSSSEPELEDSVDAPSEFKFFELFEFKLFSTNSPFIIGDTLWIGALASFLEPNGLTVIRGVTFLSTPSLGASGFRLWGLEIDKVC